MNGHYDWTVKKRFYAGQPILLYKLDQCRYVGGYVFVKYDPDSAFVWVKSKVIGIQIRQRLIDIVKE